MKSMVSLDKMSPKARRDIALEKRNVWIMNPVTRVQESRKLAAEIEQYKQAIRDAEDALDAAEEELAEELEKRYQIMQ